MMWAVFYFAKQNRKRSSQPPAPVRGEPFTASGRAARAALSLRSGPALQNRKQSSIITASGRAARAALSLRSGPALQNRKQSSIITASGRAARAALSLRSGPALQNRKQSSHPPAPVRGEPFTASGRAGYKPDFGAKRPKGSGEYGPQCPCGAVTENSADRACRRR